MSKRVGSIVWLLALCIALAGCWDNQPPEQSAFVTMIGLDMDPEKPEHKIITQMAVLPAGLSAGASGETPDGTPFYLLSTSKRTLEDAQMDVLHHLSRLPRLDHLAAIVISEETAREGKTVKPTISWALRHPQIRPGVFLFVAEGAAQEFLDARPALDPLPGAALVGLMRHSARVSSVFPVRTYEFAMAILSPRKDGALPIVRRADPLTARVSPDFEQQPFAGSSGGEVGGDTSESTDSQVELVGMAIFKEETMVGALVEQDAEGVVWLTGVGKSGLSVQHPEHEDKFVNAVAIRSSAKRNAHLKNDQIALTIKIDASMDVWGVGQLEPMGIGPDVKDVAKALEEAIKKRVAKTMEALQQLEADIFGFAEELYRSAPKDWEEVSKRWDALYADASVDIDVKVQVRRTGLSR